MRKWIKSGLEVGTKVNVPYELFQEPEDVKKRLISCTYIGETASGIMVDCKFTPAHGTREPEMYHYRMHINWANIWCGHTKVTLEDGTLIRAKLPKR